AADRAHHAGPQSSQPGHDVHGRALRLQVGHAERRQLRDQLGGLGV
ncbi:MAG: hypothetical protein AVDCRST_MAG57-923, partial [uncultured Blastococcus sp.]